MAAAIIPLLLGGFAGKAISDSRAAKKRNAPAAAAPAAKTVDNSKVDAINKATTEQQAAGEKSSKKAVAFLKDRNAQGFGSNPNKAKPFLLSL